MAIRNSSWVNWHKYLFRVSRDWISFMSSRCSIGKGFLSCTLNVYSWVKGNSAGTCKSSRHFRFHTQLWLADILVPKLRYGLRAVVGHCISGELRPVPQPGKQPLLGNVYRNTMNAVCFFLMTTFCNTSVFLKPVRRISIKLCMYFRMAVTHTGLSNWCFRYTVSQKT